VARERYKERIQLQHAQPSHQEMSSRDFQHEVLTLLNQIQEETNMMEVSQVGLENTLHSISLSLQTSGQITHQAGEAGETWAEIHLSDVQGHQLQYAADHIDPIVQKLDEIRHSLQTMNNVPAPPASSPPAPSPSYQQPSAAQTQSQNQWLSNEVRTSVNDASSRLLNDVRNYFNGELKKTTDSIRSLQNDQRQLQNQLTTATEEMRNSGGVGSLLYILLIANLIISILGIVVFKQGQDRFGKIL